MGCPAGFTVVDERPVAVLVNLTWTFWTLVVLDGKVYENDAVLFFTPLTAVFSGMGTVEFM